MLVALIAVGRWKSRTAALSVLALENPALAWILIRTSAVPEPTRPAWRLAGSVLTVFYDEGRDIQAELKRDNTIDRHDFGEVAVRSMS